MDILSVASGLRFIQIDYPVATEAPLHTHEDAASLNLCLAGSVRETVERRTHVLPPSSLSLMPCGIPHANWFSPGSRMFLVVLDPHWMGRILRSSPVMGAPRIFESSRPGWIASRMFQEFRRRDSLSELALEGMLLELIADLARETRDDARGTPTWLNQATDFLRAHFTRNLTAQEIADAVGVHPAHLMRSFRHKHRCTIGEYVRTLRVEYACRALTTRDASLAQIAAEAGFADQSHFNRTFRREMGASPAEFRLSCRNAIPRSKTQF